MRNDLFVFQHTEDKNKVIGTLTGRNACVYPAYAYIETAPVTTLGSVLNTAFGDEILPPSRYLLSLETWQSITEELKTTL